MAKHSRRYNEMVATIDREKRYEIADAVKILLEAKGKVKFEASIELAIKLNIDTKQADQMVRGSFALPNGTGKSRRVIAFCEGQMAEDAKAAGAIDAGGEELAKKVLGGWMDFDVAIAHPGMMRAVSPLGRVLGPQGKMPSPKSGTVTPDVVTAVKEFQGGRVEFRADAFGNIHVAVGRASWDVAKVADNVKAFIDHINSVKPASVKGIFLHKAAVSTTMGPGLKLAV
jgi:large subunit ribosomal protein L1